MTDTEQRMILEIITPNGRLERMECDSVHLTLSDTRDGRGGGAFGIRRGHADCVLLLSDGATVAMSDGEEVLSVHTGDGFAVIESNVVSVVVDRAQK